MNLYHLTQNKVDGYDTYSDCVVAAKDATHAIFIHPNPSVNWDGAEWKYQIHYVTGELGPIMTHSDDDWPEPNHVTATLVGTAVDGAKAGVICSSFHAG